MTSSAGPRARRAMNAILVGGLIAGACDITYAIVFSHFRGVSPARVLQSVASGLLGANAFAGGVRVAALGLALHFAIALSWATLFYLISRRLSALTRMPVLSGLVYGALIYSAMYLVVLPNSAYAMHITFTTASVARNLFVHMFFIGLPIALAARRFAPNVTSVVIT